MKLRWSAIFVWAVWAACAAAQSDSEYSCRNEDLKAATWMFQQGAFAAAGIYAEVLGENLRSSQEPLCTAALLNNLGTASHALGRDGEAENYFKRAIAVLRNATDPDDTLRLRAVNNLAVHYVDRRLFARAERLGLRSLASRLNSPSIAAGDAVDLLAILGSLDVAQKKYVSAESYYRKALAISEKLGPDRVDTIQILSNLGRLYRRSGRIAEAASCYASAMAIAEVALPPGHPTWVLLLANASGVQEPPVAEQYCRRALAIAERSLGPDHRLMGEVLIEYAGALRRLDRKAEAKRCEKRAKAILAFVARDDPGRFTVDVADLER